MFGVPDHHDWGIRGQRGDRHIQPPLTFVQVAGFPRHGRFREQNHGGRRNRNNAPCRGHGAHGSNVPPLIDGLEFMARLGAQRRIVAYEKNDVFPTCHFIITHFLVCLLGSRSASSACALAVQDTKYFRRQFLDAERFGHVRKTISFQEFLGLRGDHVASHKQKPLLQGIPRARQRLVEMLPVQSGHFHVANDQVEPRAQIPPREMAW